MRDKDNHFSTWHRPELNFLFVLISACFHTRFQWIRLILLIIYYLTRKSKHLRYVLFNLTKIHTHVLWIMSCSVLAIFHFILKTDHYISFNICTLYYNLIFLFKINTIINSICSAIYQIYSTTKMIIDIKFLQINDFRQNLQQPITRSQLMKVCNYWHICVNMDAIPAAEFWNSMRSWNDIKIYSHKL